MEEDHSDLSAEKKTEHHEHHKADQSKFKFSLKSWIKRLEWQDWVFILLLLFFIIYNLSIIGNLNQLPSPLYGGDLYYHLGYIHHLERGGSVFENSQLGGEYPWAPFFYHYMALIFSSFLGIGALTGILYLSEVFLFFSLMIIYLLGKSFFKKKEIALFLVIIYGFSFPAFKYTNLATLILYPLFFFFSFKAIKDNKTKDYILSGIVLGTIGLTHTSGFMVYFLLTCFILLYFGLFNFIQLNHKSYWKREEITKYWKDNYYKWALLFFLGIGISLIYWSIPLFKFGLVTNNTISEYDQIDLTTHFLENFLSYWKDLFFNFKIGLKGIYSNILSILFIFGTAGVCFIRNKSIEIKYLGTVLLALIILPNHYLLTLPLIKREFFSGLMGGHLSLIVKGMVSLLGIILILNKVKDKLKKTIIILFLFLFFVSGLVNNHLEYKENPWMQQSKEELPSYIKEISNWLIKNTKIEETIISTNEASFMINSISGNKVLNSRRAHSGMWVDVDQRWLDSAIILYGNNSEERNKLINKYNIKYLYWQYNWVSLDYSFDQEGKLVGWFDPLIIKYSPEYEETLKDNGINYFITNTWLDPTNRFNQVKTFKVLFIFPHHINDNEPWNPGLNNLLKIKKEFLQNGEVVAKIYQIQQ